MESSKNCHRVFAIIFLMLGSSLAWNRDYYTAAIFEHSRQGDNITYDAAEVVISNLEYYKRAAKLAKEKGADLIVYPEYGLFAPLNRSEQKAYLEFIPNPKQARVTPCDESELYGNASIMRSLSCMAKTNDIVIVANMGGIEECGNETGCPEDGDLHLNANVAFDNKGTLIGRYYKEHLFFEAGMDLPRKPQDPIFETQFGKFAMFICFDSIFEKMTMVSQVKDVDAILFSTMWINSSPFYISTQWWQAWAIGNNATILASNIQIPGYLSTGSGIYSGKEPSDAHTLNPDGIPKLIVAKISKSGEEDAISQVSVTALLENGDDEAWRNDGKDVPEMCSYKILGKAKNIYKDYRCTNEDVQNYTLVKLRKAEGRLEACHNHMCCQLDYMANNMNESYYFGVYNGTYNSFNRYYWWEENCFLARCDDVNGTACAIFPMASDETVFHKISMTANFSTKYIYPSFVSNRARLVPVDNWTFNKKPDWSSITMTSEAGIPVIAATLKGRVYERDPPYIR